MPSDMVYELFIGVFDPHRVLFIDCYTHDDCNGTSDTCVSNHCHCGSNVRCSINSDICKGGNCRCGENEECAENEFCGLGKCNGMLLLIFKYYFPPYELYG